jgi:hypothetical protein
MALMRRPGCQLHWDGVHVLAVLTRPTVAAGANVPHF